MAKSDFESLKVLLTLNSLQVVVPMFAFILAVTLLIMSINLLSKQLLWAGGRRLTFELFEKALEQAAAKKVIVEYIVVSTMYLN